MKNRAGYPARNFFSPERVEEGKEVVFLNYGPRGYILSQAYIDQTKYAIDKAANNTKRVWAVLGKFGRLAHIYNIEGG